MERLGHHLTPLREGFRSKKMPSSDILRNCYRFNQCPQAQKRKTRCSKASHARLRKKRRSLSQIKSTQNGSQTSFHLTKRSTKQEQTWVDDSGMSGTASKCFRREPKLKSRFQTSFQMMTNQNTRFYRQPTPSSVLFGTFCQLNPLIQLADMSTAASQRRFIVWRSHFVTSWVMSWHTPTRMRSLSWFTQRLGTWTIMMVLSTGLLSKQSRG